MNATLLKRLFRAIQSGSPADVEVLCQRIVDDERKHGHRRVAEELERILVEEPPAGVRQKPLSPLPTSGRDSAQLLRPIPVEQLRHYMVLPQLVEARFHRIEKEYAARIRLAKHGLKPRRRILLYGPPGCGKTLGAERLAWNTGLPLLKVRFDTLLSSYFGETLANLRKVFDAAEELPSVLLLDECDSLARSRTERNDIGEVNRITNALLEMLEEFKGEGLIIATTNLDSVLDSALFRRFDEVLQVPLPNLKEIQRLLESTLESMETEKGLAWREFARAMDGMSGAEVVRVAENAAKHCVLEGRRTVSATDIQFSLDEIQERHNANAINHE